MLAFCVLVTVLIIYIVRKNSADKAELLRYTQRDALTGLYNKDTTQRLIQNIVQEEAGQHAFIILDIDYFKSVNDNFGHIVGDKVLQTFGRFLQSQFREYDVVGRIGGDEFVILMCNLANTDVVEIKIQNLLKQVGSIRVEEMGEQKMTTVWGLLLHPSMEVLLWIFIERRIMHCIRRNVRVKTDIPCINGRKFDSENVLRIFCRNR